MDHDDVTEAITRIVGLLGEKYVFPDLGLRIGGVLTASLASGRYPVGIDAADLAERVTEDLQSVNGDLHLRLLHSPEELHDDAGDDAAELAALAVLARESGGGIGRVERLAGNIGLIEIAPLLFPPDLAADAITAAMTLVDGASGVILDLRRCRGGAPDTVAYLCSYLFGPEPMYLNGVYQRADDAIRQYWTLPHVPGPRLGPGRPIAVLTSAMTFSGGEELAFDLQERGRATIVGEVTRGGAHPREAFVVHPHLEVTIPVARSVSPLSGTNWEGTGVVPDLQVPADQALEAAVDHLRAAATSH